MEAAVILAIIAAAAIQEITAAAPVAATPAEITIAAAATPAGITIAAAAITAGIIMAAAAITAGITIPVAVILAAAEPVEAVITAGVTRLVSVMDTIRDIRMAAMPAVMEESCLLPALVQTAAAAAILVINLENYRAMWCQAGRLRPACC